MIEKKQKDDFFDTKYGLNLSVLDLEEKPNQPDYSECIVNLSNSILKHYGWELPLLPQSDLFLL